MVLQCLSSVLMVFFVSAKPHHSLQHQHKITIKTVGANIQNRNQHRIKTKGKRRREKEQKEGKGGTPLRSSREKADSDPNPLASLLTQKQREKRPHRRAGPAPKAATQQKYPPACKVKHAHKFNASKREEGER
jgi:hypothetical protein